MLLAALVTIICLPDDEDDNGADSLRLIVKKRNFRKEEYLSQKRLLRPVAVTFQELNPRTDLRLVSEAHPVYCTETHDETGG
jgi:hypothetical protein